MSPASAAIRPNAQAADLSSDPHDRALVRHMLTLTPAERLHNVAAYWPVVRVGLERRRSVGGTHRP
jgi:hypothetical protein